MKKDKWIAGLLSWVLPGLGHFYVGVNGGWWIVGGILAYLSIFVFVGIIFYPLIVILAIVDSVKQVDRYNAKLNN